MSKIEKLIEALLSDFYGDAIDWRSVLDGEELTVRASVNKAEAETKSITFNGDGVRQVAPPLPFDAITAANVLLDITSKKGT